MIFRIIKGIKSRIKIVLTLLIELYVKIKWRFFRSIYRSHELPGMLIVSLTSYPPRFSTLHLTLKSLLMQTIKPDTIILWIAYEDRDLIPKQLFNLCKYGLEIRYCDNLRSYKKIIPTLKLYPKAFIVTADDDLYYWKTWLSELVKEYVVNKHEVVCQRAHFILHQDGKPKPYCEWDNETRKQSPSKYIFPTSGGGVLYPPDVFYKDVTNEAYFITMCPTGDDIWLYFMALLNGAIFRKIGKNRRMYSWHGSQKVSLWEINGIGMQNDIQITNILSNYKCNIFDGSI